MASAPPRVADDVPTAPSSSHARDRAVDEVDRVFRIVKEELGVLVKTSTPTTKLIAGVLVSSFATHAVFGRWTSQYLALVPEKTVPCVWNVVTSGFYEMHLIGCVVDVLGVLYLGRLLEPIWGTTEFVRFVASVQCAVGAAAFVTMYALYVCTLSQFYLFAEFSGFHGVLLGLTVALRQQLPDERVPLPPPLRAATRLRNKHLPGAYLVAAGVVSLASGAKHHHLGLWLFAAYGAFAGWCYLRYFQRVARDRANDDEDSSRLDAESVLVFGDDREEFEFAAQFPDACAPAIRVLTDPIHALLCGGKRAPSARFPGGARGGPRDTLLEADAEAAGGREESTEAAEKRRARADRGARLLEEKMNEAAFKKPRSAVGEIEETDEA